MLVGALPAGVTNPLQGFPWTGCGVVDHSMILGGCYRAPRTMLIAGSFVKGLIAQEEPPNCIIKKQRKNGGL
jgi:hypothetical protein